MNDIDVWIDVYMNGANSTDAIVGSVSLLIVSGLTSVLYAAWTKIHKCGERFQGGGRWSAFALSFIVSTLYIVARPGQSDIITTIMLITLLSVLTFFMITNALTRFTYHYVSKFFDAIGNNKNGETNT